MAHAMAHAGVLEQLDTDGNGTVSLEELQAAMPDMTEETFVSMDTNGDGSLDLDEIGAAMDAGTLAM
ncbi:EF-hand domain-containing protein [Rhodobacterales bacterium HKCCE3408]|nr:EF-hand domain-containing protein [Rhodobacterales bacterium HKCCE3408]